MNTDTQSGGSGVEGQTFSHYRVLEKLGEGGMGEVYLAEDTTLKRKVALKVLPETHQQDPISHKRFIREAESAAALDHPYVCKIYEVGEHEGRNFIAMEYLRGQTLKERLVEGPLPLAEALRIGSEIAEALEEAHERGIVHRDLKPANIMLTPKGHAQVLDFGLAKRVTEDGQEITTEVTREGTTLGTLAYMSPEQLRGEPVDTRSDIFSLAVVLYEMLTGVHPFRKAEHVQTMAAILHREAEDLTDLIDNVPEALSQMVGKMLAKDPAERFQSVAEVVAILSDPSAPWKIHARPLFGKWAFSALILALVLAIALVGWWTLREGASSGEPIVSSIAVLPLENLSGDPEQEYFADGMTEELITSLSRIGALKVISRSSVMRYKGSEKAASEIAGELGVEALIQGSALREGNRVRITAQLTEAASGNNLWADRYESEMTSIMALQCEVAQAIARQIQVTLTPGEENLLTSARQVNPESYEAYLKGMSHWYDFTPSGLDRALHYFELALEKDPDYALAHVGVALVWGVRRIFMFTPAEEADPKEWAALRRALELDDTLPEAHFKLAGRKTWGDWEWESAETSFRRALELNPNLAIARSYYGAYLTIMQRPDEALAQIERAMELDPFNVVFQYHYGQTLLSTGRYDEAVEHFQKVHDSAPNDPIPLALLREAFHGKGLYEEAFETEIEWAAVKQDLELVNALEQGYEEAGYVGACRRGAETLVARSESAIVDYNKVADYYAAAGQSQAALDWLERSVEEHNSLVPNMGVLPITGSLRGEPRFQELLQRMNLPEDVIARTLNERQ